MNRIEWIIENLQVEMTDYETKYPEEDENTRWSPIPRWKKQIAFFEWLLTESEEPPLYELHDTRISPTVWGMGDVSYHMSIQLQKMKTGSSPKVLIFDYRPPKDDVKNGV